MTPLSTSPMTVSHPTSQGDRAVPSACQRVDLTFFADGCILHPLKRAQIDRSDADTHSERTKFIADAQTLTDEIVSPSGAMGHVRDLLNVWAVFAVQRRTSPCSTHESA